MQDRIQQNGPKKKPFISFYRMMISMMMLPQKYTWRVGALRNFQNLQFILVSKLQITKRSLFSYTCITAKHMASLTSRDDPRKWSYSETIGFALYKYELEDVAGWIYQNRFAATHWANSTLKDIKEAFQDSPPPTSFYGFWNSLFSSQGKSVESKQFA